MAQPQPTTALYRHAMRVVVAGLVINASLGAAKLIAGIVGHSFALIADSVNSLGDVFTAAVVLFAMRVAQKPPDAEHPYGHTRAEAVAGSNVALLVLVSAALVGWEAIGRWTSEHAIPPAWTLVIAGVNVVIKEGLYRYSRAAGRRTGSTALLANAWDHRSDALCALAVLVGLLIVRVGGEGLIWVDEAAALVVVAVIVWSSARLLRSSASELMDRQADEEMVQKVEAIAMQVDEVRCVETLRIRKSGMEYFADMHIEVDPALSVREGHAIGHRVKERILQRCTCVRDILVHIEPHDPADAGAEAEQES